jgi:formylglycine-generating enzyme required for sulfatase activity
MTIQKNTTPHAHAHEHSQNHTQNHAQNHVEHQIHLNQAKVTPPKSKKPWIITLIIVVILAAGRIWFVQSQHAKLDAHQNMEWVRINGGSYQMGLGVPGMSQQEVTVSNLLVAKSEITVAQYHKCVEAGACDLKDVGKSIFGNSDHCNWGKTNRFNYPMNCVTWHQARAFAKWAGGDLPSEAQWEYIARSEGKSEFYPWGDQSPNCVYANLGDKGDGCGKRGAVDVCSYAKGHSKQGVCDLVGNVWEWMLDDFNETAQGSGNGDSPWCQVAGCGGDVNKVIRGGSWDIDSTHLSDGVRDGFKAEDRRHTVGFRVVK